MRDPAPLTTEDLLVKYPLDTRFTARCQCHDWKMTTVIDPGLVLTSTCGACKKRALFLHWGWDAG